MSKGQLGDFADDPDSIFVDVPPNPTWLVVIDVIVSSAAVLGGYLVATRLGASTTLAVVVALIVAGAVGMKISLFARMRRVPRPSAAQFARIRAAGSQALASFRAAHPDLRQVGWSLVAEEDTAHIVIVSGNDGGRVVPTSHVYAIDRDGSVRELDPSLHPRSSYSQRVAAPGGTTP